MTKKQIKPLRQRILNAVGLATTDQVAEVEQRARRAYEAGFDDGNDDPASGQIAAGGFGYRLASGGVREPSISWERNLESAWQLKQSNPLINRAAQIKTNYIVGPGIEPKAADPKLQVILSAFWKDNAMGSYVSELTRQWIDYGAQCVPAFVRQTDGRVKLAYIDPGLIERVIAHPENSREMWAVVVKQQYNLDAWVNDTDVQVYRIIREAETVVVKAQRFDLRHKEDCSLNNDGNRLKQEQWIRCPECSEMLEAVFPARTIEARFRNPNNGEDSEPEDITGKLTTAEQSPRAPWETVMLKHYGLTDYTGDCFFIRKNADSNQTLGRSDHLQVADTCDQRDAALFALGEREELANMIFADVAVDAGPDGVRDRARELRDVPPTPGSMNVHGATETWNMNSPTLNQTASVGTIDAQTEDILGGEGIPKAWFGSPGGAHLATAQAQGDPTWRTFSHDQGQIQTWFVGMLEFVRDQAIIAGTYRPEPTIDDAGEEIPADTSVELPMPEMTVKDTVGLAGALSAIVGALSLAKSESFISQEDGIDTTAKVLAELDVHPNVDELKDAVVNEQQGTALGLGSEDAVENERSWFRIHAPVEVE